MSGEKGPHGGLTRRSFLKTTGVVAGAATLAGCTSTLEESGSAETEEYLSYEAGQIETDEEQIFRGVCRPNCFAFCHLNVHVRDGKVVKTSRAPYNEACYSRICQRGLSHVSRIYDPNRVQYPLRRAEGTERGAGEWERLSWDEALDEIAEKITDIQAEYGESAVAFLTMSGNQSTGITAAYSRLVALLNASSIGACLDMASYYGMAAVAGIYISDFLGMQMWEGNEPTDAKNANTIVVWGANITDAQVQNWHLIKEAMQGGTKLVVIDPTFTQIASKADKWIPIRPGTDTLLKYALMYIALEQGAHDVEYLQQHTVAPFLVRGDTGLFLRGSDVGVEPVPTGEVDATTGEEVTSDPYMVLLNGALTTLDAAGVAPDIEGSYDLDGVSCRTAFELLRDEILTHDPESVSELTEVSVDDIYELAEICFDTPVYHYEGYGPQAYGNGGHTTMAGLTLCALLGNLGRSGASYGAYWSVHAGVGSTYTTPDGRSSTGFSIPAVDLKNVIETGEFGGVPAAIKMIWVYSANPLNTNTDTHAWTDVILPALDYVVVADSALTDTASYADMVLPIAQWFELEEVPNAGQTSSLNYSEKAIDPLYESKPDSEIVALLGERLGLGEYFTESQSEILEAYYNTDYGALLGMTMDDIREKKQIRMLSGDAETDPHIAYKDGLFGTTTGRFEFYRETPTVRATTTKTPTAEEIERERLPHWFPPNEAWPENELYEKYPLVMMSERPRFRVHTQWFSTPVLRELDPEPIVKINPVDAEARGICDGDYVECYNDRGSAVALAVYSEGIRPGTLVYPKGWQRYQHKSGGWSELSSTEFDVYTVNNNFMDVLCEVRVWDEEGDE